jgi:hypothetical protein
MTFLTYPRAPLNRAQRRARALEAWRDAELVVQLQWDTFLVADLASRRDAFTVYRAALHAEAAAAGALADAYSDLAEAA